MEYRPAFSCRSYRACRARKTVFTINISRLTALSPRSRAAFNRAKRSRGRVEENSSGVTPLLLLRGSGSVSQQFETFRTSDICRRRNVAGYVHNRPAHVEEAIDPEHNCD